MYIQWFFLLVSNQVVYHQLVGPIKSSTPFLTQTFVSPHRLRREYSMGVCICILRNWSRLSSSYSSSHTSPLGIVSCDRPTELTQWEAPRRSGRESRTSTGRKTSQPPTILRRVERIPSVTFLTSLPVDGPEHSRVRLKYRSTSRYLYL